MYALKRRFLGPGEQPGNHLRFGLLGLPNAGKSTLFNAMLDPVRPVSIGDFLFTTLETTIGSGYCPDTRMEWLASLYKADVVSRTPYSLLDGPGIVGGSFHGAGEGLSFLPKYRDVEIFIHVLRAFDSDEVTHYENSMIDPVRDAKTLINQLMRYDLDEIDVKLRRLEAQLEQMKKEFAPIGRHLLVEIRTLTKAWECLLGQDRIALTEEQKSEMRRKGKSLEIRVDFPDILPGVPLRFVAWSPLEAEIVKKYSFFSAKEMIYVLNVSERDHLRGHCKWTEPVRQALDDPAGKMGGGLLLPLSCEFEWKMRLMGRDGSLNRYVSTNPRHEEVSRTRGIPALLYSCNRLLELISFYTFNPEAKELKVWLCRQGTNIKDAANLIDYQLYKNFQRGEVYCYDDIVEFKGNFALLDEFGKHRHQVKSYIILDGDCIDFKSY